MLAFLLVLLTSVLLIRARARDANLASPGPIPFSKPIFGRKATDRDISRKYESNRELSSGHQKKLNAVQAHDVDRCSTTLCASLGNFGSDDNSSRPIPMILRSPAFRFGVRSSSVNKLRGRKRVGFGAGRVLANLLFLLASLLIACLTGRTCLAQSLDNIFGNTVPPNGAAADYRAVTLGVKFWSSEGGTISGIRFYRGAASPAGYIASLYTANGKLRGSVTLAQESGPVPGWQTAIFPEPIPIAANTTYIASYYAPTGQYAYQHYGLRTGATNGPLNIPPSYTVGGNGVYTYALAFPTLSYEASNYYVDVLFMPAAPIPAPPVLSLSFEPPNPKIPSNTPKGATVATIITSWSNGDLFTGTLGFGSPNFDAGGVFAISGNSLIINPLGPGLNAPGGTIEHVTVDATQ